MGNDGVGYVSLGHVEYPGLHRRPAQAEVRIYRRPGAGGDSYVVVLAQIPGYEGLSITNGIEKLASHLMGATASWAHTITDPGRVLWIEHYPAETRGSMGESWDWVTFSWIAYPGQGLRAASPNWVHLDREAVERLIGGKYA